MGKEKVPEQASGEKYTTNDDQFLAEAMRFVERLNERSRLTPPAPPLEGAALEALISFQATVARLQVLKPQ